MGRIDIAYGAAYLRPWASGARRIRRRRDPSDRSGASASAACVLRARARSVRVAARSGTSALPSSYANPRSAQIAAMAPSTLTGSGRPISLWRAVERALDRTQHPDVLAFELEFERHLEQPRRARIARVKAMAESGRHDRLAHALVDQMRRPPPASTRRRASATAPDRETACTTRCRRRDAGRTRGCRPRPHPSAARPMWRRCARRAWTAASRRDRATTPGSR